MVWVWVVGMRCVGVSFAVFIVRLNSSSRRYFFLLDLSFLCFLDVLFRCLDCCCLVVMIDLSTTPLSPSSFPVVVVVVASTPPFVVPNSLSSRCFFLVVRSFLCFFDFLERLGLVSDF